MGYFDRVKRDDEWRDAPSGTSDSPRNAPAGKETQAEPKTGALTPVNPDPDPGFRDKKDKNRYKTAALYAFFVLAVAILLVFLFRNYGDFSVYIEKVAQVFRPVMLGAIFAYLLNPLLRLFERHVFAFIGKKSGKMRSRRIVSVIVTYFTLLLAITGFIWLLVPQVVSGYKDLAANMNGYITSVQAWLVALAEKSRFFSEPMLKVAEYISDLIHNIYTLLEKVVPSITGAISGVVVAVKNSVLGLVLSVYFLLSKEQLGAVMKKILCSLLKPTLYDRVLEDADDADKRFGRYLVGNVVSSLFVGLLCLGGMAVFGMPYSPLISLIVGITNIIPVFGPIIGGAVGAFILFIANPIDALWFLIMIIVIQQVDGNYLCPKIFGTATGLEPVWVMIAITLMSGFFGFIGMLFGVPIFAVVYYLIKGQMEKRLERKGRAPQTGAYLGTEAGRRLYAERESTTQKKSNSRLNRFMHKQSEKLGLAVRNTITEIERITTRDINVSELVEAEKKAEALKATEQKAAEKKGNPLQNPPSAGERKSGSPK